MKVVWDNCIQKKGWKDMKYVTPEMEIMEINGYVVVQTSPTDEEKDLELGVPEF